MSVKLGPLVGPILTTSERRSSADIATPFYTLHIKNHTVMFARLALSLRDILATSRTSTEHPTFLRQSRSGREVCPDVVQK